MFSGDSAVVGRSTGGGEREYRTVVDNFVTWSKNNTATAQWQRQRLRSWWWTTDHCQHPGGPLGHCGTLGRKLDWTQQMQCVYKNGQSCLYYLRQLQPFDVFFSTFIQQKIWINFIFSSLAASFLKFSSNLMTTYLFWSPDQSQLSGLIVPHRETRAPRSNQSSNTSPIPPSHSYIINYWLCFLNTWRCCDTVDVSICFSCTPYFISIYCLLQFNPLYTL